MRLLFQKVKQKNLNCRKTCNIIITILFLAINQNAHPQNRIDSSEFTFRFGLSYNDLTFKESNSPLIYDFQSSFPVLVLTWKNFLISVGYGKQLPTLRIPPLSILEATLAAQLSIPVLDIKFVPSFIASMLFRLTNRYRKLSPGQGSVISNSVETINSEAGVGLSGIVQPLSFQKLFVSFSIVSSLGVLSSLSTKTTDEIRFSRAIDINTEIKVDRLLFNKIGIVFSCSYLSERWTDRKPESFQQVVKSITKLGTIPKRRGQLIYSLGFTL